MTDANQDLAAFIAAHGKPYDAATDSYRRAPFAEPIKAGKNTAIYNAHSYHTKVPPQGIVPYIEHYTEPGDLVLDPFCGSGMTGVAALMSGRSAILNDLSPAAVHIAKNYCTPLDVKDLRKEYLRIGAAVQEEFEWLYGTSCNRCGASATIIYIVWSDVFQCSRCDGEIVLWDAAVDRETGQVKSIFTCPHCGKEQKKAGLRRLPEQPVLTLKECTNCHPRREFRRTSMEERNLIEEIAGKHIPYWIPDTEFDRKGAQYRRNALANRNINKVIDLYTPRNLWALARLWHEARLAQSDRLTHMLHFALTGISIRLGSRLTGYQFGKRGNVPISGTIYVPSFSVERNIWDAFTGRILDIERGWSELPVGSVFPVIGSATEMTWLEENTIDYVFTDPPFGSSIYYSDVNLLWEAWLQDFTNAADEAVVHRDQDGGTKRTPDYTRLMIGAFREIYRILKPGRWASVVFHNSDDKIWQIILDAADDAGFELAEINAFDKAQLSFKGIRGQKGLERVTNKDLVLNLRKPAPGQQAVTNGTVYADEQERRVVEAIADFLDSNPPQEDRTLQGIWNHALDRMLREGSVQVNMAAVGEMLPHYFKSVDGRWYLRGDTVLGDNVFDLRNDSSALAWLYQVLGNEPQTTGELIPNWQAATVYLDANESGRLDRLLRENFWEDKRGGRWRIPTNEERDKMSARQSLADEAHLRTVRRYLDGKLNERVNDWKRFEWARFCYNREAYAEAIALAQQIDATRLDPEQAQALKRLIVVCRQRAGNTPAAG